MARFKTIDAAAFEAAEDRGRKAYATPRAIAARFDKRAHRVIVALDTGIDFAFDPARAPELRDAAPEDLAGVTMDGVGSTPLPPAWTRISPSPAFWKGSSGRWIGPGAR